VSTQNVISHVMNKSRKRRCCQEKKVETFTECLLYDMERNTTLEA